ncbi:MAG: dipicolinate synthase subunit DpsA [Ruminococcus callidus]
MENRRNAERRENYDIRQCDSVAGGDLRQQYAARRLRQKTGADVWTLGLPAQSGLHSAETLEEVPAYDVLVLPVPASPDGTTVPAPFGKAALPLETLAAHGKPGRWCWAERAAAFFRGWNPGDWRRRTISAGRNSAWRMPCRSAEGAIQIAMEETARTLHGTAALVIGYGRIGMALAPRLRGLGMDVTVCARQCETRRWQRCRDSLPCRWNSSRLRQRQPR